VEQISWQPPALQLVLVHHIHRRTAHVFRAELSVPLERLQLLGRQELGLVSAEELLLGSIWSTRLRGLRPVADALQELMQPVISGQGEHNKARSVGPGPWPAQPWCLAKGVGQAWRG
jgi:hypothetical protein